MFFWQNTAPSGRLFTINRNLDKHYNGNIINYHVTLDLRTNFIRGPLPPPRPPFLSLATSTLFSIRVSRVSEFRHIRFPPRIHSLVRCFPKIVVMNVFFFIIIIITVHDKYFLSNNNNDYYYCRLIDCIITIHIPVLSLRARVSSRVVRRA